MIRVYDSIAVMREEALRLNATSFDDGSASQWHGNESADDVVRRTLVGDTRLVPEAEKLLSQLETEIEVPRRVWDRSVAGAYVVVPDVVVGLPTPFRRIREVGDEHSPITIFASVAPSASITADMFLKRGVTILGLVLALSRIRPISLHIIDYGDGDRDGTGESVLCARVNTDPLDVATAAYALTSVGFVRHMHFGLEKALNGFCGQWPRKFNAYKQKPYNDYLVSKLSPDPKRTLFISAAHTVNEPILREPVKWINEQIRHFIGAKRRRSSGGVTC